ncbi:hypothetical protein GCM10010094_68740 [Streptomyces flaveus]|uniref:Uncharacterized protein n=1 Tax=Streptomyces flaveus TaxID=66370 RepID=A0A917RA93_9ACTN|nr:hypothetical protein GCM10010094_68740 [Streptomyces flaveus]
MELDALAGHGGTAPARTGRREQYGIDGSLADWAGRAVRRSRAGIARVERRDTERRAPRSLAP